MLTAGHCFDLDETVNSPIGTTFGVVKRLDDFPHDDFELVGGTGDAIEMGKAIYIGDSTGVKGMVYGAEAAAFSPTYCFSGAAQEERCYQPLSDDDIPYVDSYGTTVHTQLFDAVDDYRMRYSPCSGDSGAPMYRYTTGGPGIADSHVKVVGIIIAGDCAVAESGGVTFIESWPKIADTYGVTIKSH